jgi:hypothetical protein
MSIKQSSISIRFLFTISIVILSTGGIGSVFAVDVPDPSIMLPLVPKAADADAPQCIKPGTRLTYFGMTASIPGSYGKLVQDDNGNWEDKNTGKRYREEDIGGSGAAAYNVVHVDYVGGGIAQLSNRLYTYDISTKKSSFAGGSGMVGHAGCAADYWINPQVLEQVREVNTEGIRILRMPYTVAGKTYKAIRFQREDISGYQARVYDLESGLMIFYGSRVQGPSVTTAPTGLFNTTGTGEGSTQVVTGWIVDVNNVDVPWKAAAAPNWVEQFKQLSYKGVQTSVVAAAGTRLNRSMLVTCTPKARGSGWLRFTNSMVIESLPGMPPETITQEGASGGASIGGLWIPPDAIAGLRPQQVIETNKLVGATVTVSRKTQDSVTISEVGPLHHVDWTYDAKTGMLSAMTLTQQVGLAQITHSIQLSGRQ